MQTICLLFLSGNRALLPSPKAHASSEASESGNLIVYNGAMVDVGSMMQKLEKSEKAREEIEQKLITQDAKMGKQWIVASCSFVGNKLHNTRVSSGQCLHSI